LKDEFDVVIVGGGPVGLWLACELALAQIRVVVLERRTESITQSRALAIQGRTVEVFAMRGLADRFVSRGRAIPHGHFAGLATGLDFSVFESRFPFTLLLPQAMTEMLLAERARELDLDVRRGYQVETVKTLEDEVVVEGRSESGPFRFCARYAVGADGARSIVRSAAGIEFTGHSAHHAFALAELVLDSPPERPLVTVVNEVGNALIASRGDGVNHRVVVDAAATISTSEPVSFEEFTAHLARVAGTDYRPRDPIWLTRFTDETRLARHYRRRRILLAGDAAHIHAPMGGQGLNVGIQDAMNLGWKLARVISGAAPEDLLDTYERERKPVGEALRRNTLSQVALFCKFDPAALALRSTFEDLLKLPAINRQLAAEGSGFEVAYPEPLFAPNAGWQHRAGVSGQRLPDMDLVLADGSRSNLYNFLQTGEWIQLQIAFEKVPASARLGITTVNLAPDACGGILAGLTSALVRPDGHLAHIFPKVNGQNAE
jgi:2-polyprenyl-6-methoxyphenol hydroxylase-like FAD-dependent oxidoreductase